VILIRIIVISESEYDCRIITDLLSVQNDFRICGKGKTGYDALQCAADLQPDIIIADMFMKDINIVDLAPLIKRKSPATELIVIGSFIEDIWIYKALKAGISGFLFKPADMDMLDAAVRTVLCGGYYFSSLDINCILSILSKTKPAFNLMPRTVGPQARNALSQISTTERNIIKFLVQGRSDKEIARALHIAAGTVRNIIASVKRRTGLKNRVEVVVNAIANDFVNM